VSGLLICSGLAIKAFAAAAYVHTAYQQIFHTAEYPSRITLPVNFR
jgi:hypothetical protein